MITQKERISQLLVYLAQLNHVPMNDIIIDLYVRELDKFPGNQAIKALEKAVCAGKFPSIDDLRDSAGLETQRSIDARLKADLRSVPGLIMNAIQQAGMYNSNRAQEIMGEQAWSICMQVFGSWQLCCELVNNENWSTYSAQIRGVAESQFESKKLRLAASSQQLIEGRV